MKSINLKEDIINSINTLPSDMLEEVYKFLDFLEYKNFSKSSNLSKDNTLDDFRDSIKDIQKLKNGDTSMLYNGSLDDMINELR